MNSPRPFLCGHAPPKRTIRGGKDLCSHCGSFWDLKSLRASAAYGNTYAADRGHLDPLIGRLKVQTMDRWFAQLQMGSRTRVVCEVGFGGAWTLAALHARSWSVHGLEADDTLLAHATALGLPDNRLHLFAKRPAKLDPPVDLWLFQDSFEHLEDPEAFLAWMAVSSSSSAEILIVAPRADSFSQHLLGPWWPHRVEDHRFHWSQEGLVEWLQKRGWHLSRCFYPAKAITARTLLAHLAHQRHWPWLTQVSRSSSMALPLRFNIGEMGLYLKRADR